MLSISIMLVILSAVMTGYGIRIKAGYSITRSTILGLTLAIPSLISILSNVLIFLLQLTSVTLFKIGCLLGGTEFDQLTTDMLTKEIVQLMGEVRGDESEDGNNDEDKTLQ